MSDFLTSIIVPTYNGAHKIGYLIESLKNQTSQDFETIIVVDGSNDNTESLLRKMLENDSKYQIHKIQNSGRAKARNYGAKIANGEQLLFVDDDIILPKISVEFYRKLHSNDPESIYFSSVKLNEISGKDAFTKYRCGIEKQQHFEIDKKPFNSKLEQFYFRICQFFPIKIEFLGVGWVQ